MRLCKSCNTKWQIYLTLRISLQIFRQKRRNFHESEGILYALIDKEKCVYDIAQELGMSQSAISHQLSILKQNRLVKNRREGKTIYYSLLDSHVLTIIAQGLDHIRE